MNIHPELKLHVSNHTHTFKEGSNKFKELPAIKDKGRLDTWSEMSPHAAHILPLTPYTLELTASLFLVEIGQGSRTQVLEE